ncbi:glycosyltransferase family 4 protein [Chryseobacterium sp. SNU WT5]|uniref:glycosyltransferase n=1 Tax=Chryseobacterium sp. SNU WT5 TaxID=2594269 RepID=UPI00118117BF|nr:glycosyltransferase [Chryseobacterium sp. SNU WT5]QDP85355.1 glycosyltransferase family 4 protein [Chryseobacterium sp. SNU WT5]
MKVIVSAFSNLYTDQRIEKVCETLHNAGYEIKLIGNDWGGMEAVKRPYPVKLIAISSKSLKTAYAEFNWKLFKLLKQTADKNTILLANDLDALYPNYILAKKLGIPLVFDSHEIFSEMPAIQGKISQKIWRVLERKLVPEMKYMMTESFSYARWFSEKYSVDPIVIRNIPRRITERIEMLNNNPKILLYQGVINQSRGISQAILSLKFLTGVIFKIVGDGPKRVEYEQMVRDQNLENKVQFLGKLTPTELRKVTITADVALSIEENGGVSYLYSLPNKVSDCIQARVPLVMINFPEMMRVYNQFKVGEIVENHNPENLANKIKTVLENGRTFYQSELGKAAEELCWENEEPKILQLFKKVEKENF